MPETDSGIYQHGISSHAFLQRARTALSAFDAESRVDALFNAALELRFGIEARLYEYIGGALSTLHQPARRIKDYSATRLLAVLTELDPHAGGRVALRITSDQTGHATELHYTPVTKELAAVHGKLGGLLHYTYFANNEMWYFRRRFDGAGQTLLNARDLVQQGIEQLAQATAGSLLAPPRFTEVVAALNEPSASSPAVDGADGAA